MAQVRTAPKNTLHSPRPVSPDVSVCIANWNCVALLRRCLQSLFEQPQGVSFEVVVADNGSTDGAAEMVAAEFPQAVLIRNGDNRGFARASNQAAAAARGRFLFFLNNDTLVPVVALAAGVAAMSLSGGCGSNAPPGPATVRGKVTLNGQPVAGGLVVFTPDSLRGGRGKPARAETAADGSFQLQLDSSSHIPPGWYRVSLAPLPAIPDPLSTGLSPAFPAKLARPDLSGLEREVQAGKDHVFEFAVEVEASGGR